MIPSPVAVYNFEQHGAEIHKYFILHFHDVYLATIVAALRYESAEFLLLLTYPGFIYLKFTYISMYVHQWILSRIY